MNKEKEYVKNTIILLIGKFSTQFISFFMMPLYTYYLNANDYGMIDLIQTYISLFIPVLILRFDSAIFRFLVDKRDDESYKKKVISNVLVTLFFQILIFIVLFFIINEIFSIRYFVYIILNVVAVMISNIFLQLIRGIGNNKDYSIACIITSFLTLIFNLVFILGLKKGAESILISSAIANIVCSIYIYIKAKISNYFNIKLLSKNEIKELMKYSLPMIPNSLSWWIVNASDRTIISYFIGTFANGIYAVSCKFSNLLNNIFSVFSMSWQETATLHINDEDKDEFFTNMINRLYNLFFCLALCIMAILPLIFDIIIGEDYRSSYNYIPILLFANNFNVLIGLIGGVYVAKKLTKKIANTTIWAAIINIIVNLLLVNKIGLYAASISSLIAYFIMAVYRYRDVQKYVKIKIKWKNNIFLFLLFIILLINYYVVNMWSNIIILFITVFFIIYMNIDLIKEGIALIRKKIYS